MSSTNHNHNGINHAESTVRRAGRHIRDADAARCGKANAGMPARAGTHGGQPDWVLAGRARLHPPLRTARRPVRCRDRNRNHGGLRANDERAAAQGPRGGPAILGCQVGAARAQVPCIAPAAMVLRRTGRRHVSGGARREPALSQARECVEPVDHRYKQLQPHNPGTG